jgi:ABC-type dipeptide/oligopeptide/nickel transport system permease component
MTGITPKIIILALRPVIIPIIVTLLVWSAFNIVGGEIISDYKGPGIAQWLTNVYLKFDMGTAGDWTTGGQPVAPYLFQAIRNTAAVALLAILMASILSLLWTYLVWSYPYNRLISGASLVLRFFSSWPILIGAIFVAVVVRGQSLATLAMPALILGTCDNNLNDFRDNLTYEIKGVLKSDYAISAIGQGRSYFKNLLPEISWKIMSFIASRLPAIVSGVIVLELYFNINGIYVFLNIFYNHKDLNAILGITFLVSLFLTIWSSLFTFLHSVIDPRQR